MLTDQMDQSTKNSLLPEEDKKVIQEGLDIITKRYFTTVFVGAMNSTKSSTINAIVDKRRLLPTNDRPETGCTIKVRPLDVGDSSYYLSGDLNKPDISGPHYLDSSKLPSPGGPENPEDHHQGRRDGAKSLMTAYIKGLSITGFIEFIDTPGLEEDQYISDTVIQMIKELPKPIVIVFTVDGHRDLRTPDLRNIECLSKIPESQMIILITRCDVDMAKHRRDNSDMNYAQAQEKIFAQVKKTYSNLKDLGHIGSELDDTYETSKRFFFISTKKDGKKFKVHEAVTKRFVDFERTLAEMYHNYVFTKLTDVGLKIHALQLSLIAYWREELKDYQRYIDGSINISQSLGPIVKSVTSLLNQIVDSLTRVDSWKSILEDVTRSIENTSDLIDKGKSDKSKGMMQAVQEKLLDEEEQECYEELTSCLPYTRVPEARANDGILARRMFTSVLTVNVLIYLQRYQREHHDLWKVLEKDFDDFQESKRYKNSSVFMMTLGLLSDYFGPSPPERIVEDLQLGKLPLAITVAVMTAVKMAVNQIFHAAQLGEFLYCAEDEDHTHKCLKAIIDYCKDEENGNVLVEEIIKKTKEPIESLGRKSMDDIEQLKYKNEVDINDALVEKVPITNEMKDKIYTNMRNLMTAVFDTADQYTDEYLRNIDDDSDMSLCSPEPCCKSLADKLAKLSVE